MPPRTSAAAAVKHLTPAELAERLSMSTGQLANWRSQGRGPDYLRSESSGDKATVLYPVAWVEEWENRQRVRLSATA